jgi:hypothetical protein
MDKGGITLIVTDENARSDASYHRIVNCETHTDAFAKFTEYKNLGFIVRIIGVES